MEAVSASRRHPAPCALHSWRDVKTEAENCPSTGRAFALACVSVWVCDCAKCGVVLGDAKTFYLNMYTYGVVYVCTQICIYSVAWVCAWWQVNRNGLNLLVQHSASAPLRSAPLLIAPLWHFSGPVFVSVPCRSLTFGIKRAANKNRRGKQAAGHVKNSFMHCQNELE